MHKFLPSPLPNRGATYPCTRYAIYLIIYFIGAISSTTGDQQVGAGIATVLITPHLIVLIIAVIFNLLGFFIKTPAFTLVGGILYCVSALLFLVYALFEIPMIVFAFIGFAKQRKIKLMKTSVSKQ